MRPENLEARIDRELGGVSYVLDDLSHVTGDKSCSRGF